MRLIMIRTATGQLATVQAITYDTDSGSVDILTPVDLGDGPTRAVPKELCFNFDPDLLLVVNRLLLTSDSLQAQSEQMRLAACQLMDSNGQLPSFDGDDVPVRMH